MQKFLLYFLLIVISLPLQAQDMCREITGAFEVAAGIRNLKIKKKVPCHSKNIEQVEKYLKDHIERDFAVQKVKDEEKLFKAIGLIPQNYFYQEGMIDLLLSQIGGYYDPIDEYYAVANWIPANAQLPVAIHEYTHALQDQHFNLDKFLDNKDLTSDEALARSALAEGDANFVMFGFVGAQSGRGNLMALDSIDEYLLQIAASSKLNEQFSSAPVSMQAYMLFPYLSGLKFVHRIAKEKGYEYVNNAFKNLPRTTREILHPEIYMRRSFSAKIPSNEEILKLMPEPGWEIAYSDTLGEFTLGALFSGENELAQKGLKSATEWQGDKAVLLQNGERKAAAWLINFNTSDAASIFARIYKEYLSKDKQRLKDSFSILNNQNKVQLLVFY